jgi:hypothetical protein
MTSSTKLVMTVLFSWGSMGFLFSELLELCQSFSWLNGSEPFFQKRSFLKEIHAHMGSLLEKHGFSLLEEKEEPEHFGNDFAKFGSPSILLRIAKDRVTFS